MLTGWYIYTCYNYNSFKITQNESTWSYALVLSFLSGFVDLFYFYHSINVQDFSFENSVVVRYLICSIDLKENYGKSIFRIQKLLLRMLSLLLLLNFQDWVSRYHANKEHMPSIYVYNQCVANKRYPCYLVCFKFKKK